MDPVTCSWWCKVHALSVRAKLMLFYLLVTLAGLLIFGLMSFGALQYALLQGKKTHLQGRENRLISLLKENKAKGVTQSLSEQLRNYALVTHEGNLFHIHNPDGSIFFPAEGIGRDWALPGTDDCTQPVFSSVAVDKNSVLVMCHTIPLDGRMVRLHIGGSPWFRTDCAQESMDVGRARADFHVDRLEQRAALLVPVGLQRQDELLKREHEVP